MSETKKRIPPAVMTSAIALGAAILTALLMRFGMSEERAADIVAPATEMATEAFVPDVPDAKVPEGSAEVEGSGDE